MKKVKILGVTEITNAKFIKTCAILAERDDSKFHWEMVKAHNSVHVLVDNVDTKELLLVKQVRIPVLVNDSSLNGEVIEACAGLIDRDAEPIEIAIAEVLEELGYSPDKADFELVTTVKSNVGTTGATAYAYSVKVEESEKVSNGGGLSDEDIEIVRIPYTEVQNFFKDKHTDAITMMLVMNWRLETGY